MRTGVIDVGGGLRGISAGSANLEGISVFLPEMKQALGNGKSKYNTDRNCSGDFECFHSHCGKFVYVVHNKIVRSIVNACARHQYKNA